MSGSMVPPLTLVTAPLATPGFAGVPRPGFAATPPHGAVFCGSPSLFCASEAAGEISTKWASAATDRQDTTTTADTNRFFICAPEDVRRGHCTPDATGVTAPSQYRIHCRQ